MSLSQVKVIIHFLAMLPALWLLWQGWLFYDFQDNALTANPIKYIHHFTGNSAIRFVLIGLAITPGRKIFGWNKLIKFRRMMGLYAFFYAMLHFINFIVLDYFFDWATITQEIIKRPAITTGMIAAVILLLLAITSTRGWVRRMGKGWIRLHRLAYVIGLFVVTHNLVMVKADLLVPMIHTIIFALLIGYRLAAWASFFYNRKRKNA